MADLVGAYAQTQWNRENQQISYRQQQDLMRESQNYNTLMFHEANAYNSPVAQMLRFKSAGLNPNLIYGQMANTASAPSMSSPSSPSPAQAGSPSLLETAQIGLINAQKDNIEADTASKIQDVSESESRIALNGATIEKYGHENNWTDQQIEESKAQVDKIQKEKERMDAEIALFVEQKKLTSWQAVEAEINAFYADKKNQAMIDNLVSQTGLNRAQTKEILALIFAKKANLMADTAYKSAEARLTSSLARVSQSTESYQIKKSESEAGIIAAQALTDQMNADWLADHPGYLTTEKWMGVIERGIGAVGTIVSAIVLKGGVAKGLSKIPPSSPASNATLTNDAWKSQGIGTY